MIDCLQCRIKTMSSCSFAVSFCASTFGTSTILYRRWQGPLVVSASTLFWKESTRMASPAIDLQECYHDSVFFREALAQREASNLAFEDSLKSIVKIAKSMCEHGSGRHNLMRLSVWGYIEHAQPLVKRMPCWRRNWVRFQISKMLWIRLWHQHAIRWREPLEGWQIVCETFITIKTLW